MTDTASAAPSDAEIDAQWRESVEKHETTAAFVRDFARAVLAKWGTPAVAGEKVYLVATGLTNEAGTVGLYERHENFVPLADCEVLYTAPQPTQAQAGAVPLTDEQIVGVMHSIPIKAAPSYHIAFARAIEQAHGIKGGQHGTK